MRTTETRVYRVLFLCTGNSGRSQIAETIQVLGEGGIEWAGHQPRGLEGQPILSHWGMPDPSAIQGDDEEKRRAGVSP